MPQETLSICRKRAVSGANELPWGVSQKGQGPHLHQTHQGHQSPALLTLGGPALTKRKTLVCTVLYIFAREKQTQHSMMGNSKSLSGAVFQLPVQQIVV